MSITLWELRGPDDLRYSMFAWRTRLALAHKGLRADIRGVAVTDKAAIAFSGGRTVPVLHDGATVVRDSWAIAEHLEAAFPERPSLFGGEVGRALSHFVNGWTDRVLVPLVAPMIAADIVERLDPDDAAHVRQGFEAAFRASVEALRDGREARLPSLRRALEPARATLRTRDCLGGDAPAYADYVVASVLQWARLTSPIELIEPEDRVAAWFDRILDLHEGVARSHPSAAERG